MVEQIVKPGRNVIDFVDYQRALRAKEPSAIGNRWCRHCGAALLDDENEDECSTAGIMTERKGWSRPPRRFRAD